MPKRLDDEPFGQPVRRVVLSEVMANLAGQQIVVELLQQVAGVLRGELESPRIVLGQPLNQLAGGLLDVVVPGREVPPEEISFQKIANTVLPEEPPAL